MVEIREFADRLMDRFGASIADKLFIQFQRDPELMRDYQALVRRHGIVVVNAQIGARVRQRAERSAVA
jgi:hypothetical protein